MNLPTSPHEGKEQCFLDHIDDYLDQDPHGRYRIPFDRRTPPALVDRDCTYNNYSKLSTATYLIFDVVIEGLLEDRDHTTAIERLGGPKVASEVL